MNKKEQIIAFLKLKIAETLGYNINQIKDNEDIHQLGLTSLNAVIISGEVEDEFNIEVDPLVMFENNTIDKIAEKIIQNG